MALPNISPQGDDRLRAVWVTRDEAIALAKVAEVLPLLAHIVSYSFSQGVVHHATNSPGGSTCSGS